MKKVLLPERPKTAVVDGAEIEAGQRLIVEGEEGGFTFRYVMPDGSLTCWGGVNQHESWRSFRPEKCHRPGWVPPLDPEEHVSRSGRYGAFEAWASQHQNETFTTAELVEVSGFSSATMLKYLKTSLLFEPQKKGTWRVQDQGGTRIEQ